jgi:prephenate dehydrogenase
MKKIALALALVLASSSLIVGLASTDANARPNARKICKQGLKTHPMAGEHRDLMKQCKAEYKAHKKAGHARRAT